MVTRIVLFAMTALLLASLASAADDRDTKARAALVRAEPNIPHAIAHLAPAPREVKPKDYATGHKEANVEHMPLVVFVGREHAPVEGAIVARWNDYPGVTGPAIVVGYPAGGQLVQECVLACPCKSDRPDEYCPVRTGELQRAVANAARKADVKVMPPKTVDSQTRKDGCICAENCRCATGDCPAKCGGKKEPVLVGFQKVCHGTWCEWVPVYR